MELVDRPYGKQYASQMFHAWEWPVGVGILLIILGMSALVTPVATSVGLAWLLGALLLSSGIAQLIHAFRFARHSGNVIRFLLAALSIVAGALTLRNPVGGTMGITLALAFYLTMNAVGKWIMAFELRPKKGWGWFMVSALVSFALGVYLFATFPINSLVIPGLFFGIDLVFFGSSLIASALMLRRLGRTTKEALDQHRAA